MSRSTLTLASSLLLAFTPSISPADAVLHARRTEKRACPIGKHTAYGKPQPSAA